MIEIDPILMWLLLFGVGILGAVCGFLIRHCACD
jgi:hypothetical protein